MVKTISSIKYNISINFIEIETKDSIQENIKDLQKHLEKIENKRRESATDKNSQGNFSDFKPDDKSNFKLNETSNKYSYSITNKRSVDSFRPQFGHGPYTDQSSNEMSSFSKIKKQKGLVSYTIKKGSVSSEKVFKKDRIHYNLEEENKMKNEHASSMFKPLIKFPLEDEYLNLSQDQLVSKNEVPNITNLDDESIGGSRNKTDSYSAFFKNEGNSYDKKSKNSQITREVILFDESSNDQMVHM